MKKRKVLISEKSLAYYQDVKKLTRREIKELKLSTAEIKKINKKRLLKRERNKRRVFYFLQQKSRKKRPAKFSPHSIVRDMRRNGNYHRRKTMRIYRRIKRSHGKVKRITLYEAAFEVKYTPSNEEKRVDYGLLNKVKLLKPKIPRLNFEDWLEKLKKKQKKLITKTKKGIKFDNKKCKRMSYDSIIHTYNEYCKYVDERNWRSQTFADEECVLEYSVLTAERIQYVFADKARKIISGCADVRDFTRFYVCDNPIYLVGNSYSHYDSLDSLEYFDYFHGHKAFYKRSRFFRIADTSTWKSVYNMHTRVTEHEKADMDRESLLRRMEWRRPTTRSWCKVIHEDDSTLSETHFMINELQRPTDSDHDPDWPELDSYLSLFLQFFIDNESNDELQVLEEAYDRLNWGVKMYNRFHTYIVSPIKRIIIAAYKWLLKKIKFFFKFFIIFVKWIWKPIENILLLDFFIKVDRFLDKFRVVRDNIQVFVLYYIVTIIHWLKAKHEKHIKKYNILLHVRNFLKLQKIYNMYLVAEDALIDNRVIWTFTFVIFLPLCYLSSMLVGHWSILSLFFTSGAYVYYLYYIYHKGELSLDFEEVEHFFDSLFVTYSIYGVLFVSYLYDKFGLKIMPFLVLCAIIPLYISWDLEFRGEFSNPKHMSRPRRETVYLTFFTLLLAIFSDSMVRDPTYWLAMMFYVCSINSALYNLMLSAYTDDRQDLIVEIRDKVYWAADARMDFWSVPFNLYVYFSIGNTTVTKFIEFLSYCWVYVKALFAKSLAIRSGMIKWAARKQDDRRRSRTEYSISVARCMYYNHNKFKRKFKKRKTRRYKRKRTRYLSYNYYSVFETLRKRAGKLSNKPVVYSPKWYKLFKHDKGMRYLKKKRINKKKARRWSLNGRPRRRRFYVDWRGLMMRYYRYRNGYLDYIAIKRRLRVNKSLLSYKRRMLIFTDYKIKFTYFVLFYKIMEIKRERELFDEAILKATADYKPDPEEVLKDIHFDR